MKSICLSGGANKGAWALGILKHLLGDLHIQYDLLVGTSVGSLNALGLAMFPHGQEEEAVAWLESLWKSLKTSDIYYNWGNFPGFLRYLGYVAALWKPSVYDSTPLAKFIKEHYDPVRVKNSGKELRIGTVSLNTGKYHLFDQNADDIIAATLGSSSFPGAFLPIKIDGEYHTDAGVTAITPLEAAIDAGATSVDIIVSNPEKSLPVDFGKNINIMKLGPRVIDIMSDEIQKNDLARFLEINELIKAGAKIPGKRYIPARIFRPDEKLVDNTLRFEQDVIRPMIEKGYQKAKEVTGK